jgi:hypothetical protein
MADSLERVRFSTGGLPRPDDPDNFPARSWLGSHSFSGEGIMKMRAWSASAVLLCTMAFAFGCKSTAAHSSGSEAVSVDDTPFGWCLGKWTGVRKSGTDGSSAPMTATVESILGGAGQIEQLEVQTDTRVYRGVTVQAFDSKAQVWRREYVNNVNGNFVPMEGALGTSSRCDWTIRSSDRGISSRLESELVRPGFWRRTMRYSRDGGQTWEIQWIDELQKAD